MRRGIAAIMAAGCAALVVGAALSFPATSANGPSAPAFASTPAVPVVAAPVKSGNVPIYLHGIGTVDAWNTVVVRSQVEGQLIRIDFKEGQMVHKGQLLAQIDPRPYQATLDQMIANRDRDQATLQNAALDLNRYATLLPNQLTVSQQQYDTQNTTVAQLKAQIKADEAQIENARVQLGYTRLTSPIDGVTGIYQLDVGNIIYPNSTNNALVTVAQIQPIAVIFTLPEADLPEIQKQMAKGPMTVLAYSQDNKTLLGRGKLLLVNNEINQATGTLQLKAIFPNKQSRLWPGQLVNARLLLETLPHGLTVPAPAVQQGPNGSYVYVINPDRTVAIRPVTVAQIGNLRAVIASGLKAGERVVVNGQSRLQPDSRVAVVTGQAAQQLAGQSVPGMEIP
jgi:membrane fusion protein, multidrug efflux system